MNDIAAETDVLVVDDDERLRRVVVSTLANAGFDVRDAPHGRAALDQTAVAVPDLLVSDIMMPDIDGMELLRRMRRDPSTRGVYVILLTAKSLTRDVVDGFEAEADDYVTKPFQMPELVARVTAGARIHALQKSLAKKNEDLTRALSENAALLGSAAHDIRSPLSTMLNYISLLGQDFVTEEDVKKVSVTRIRHIIALVDDLLDMTRINAGEIAFYPARTRIDEHLETAVALYRQIAKQREVTVSLDTGAESIDGIVDPERFRDLLENILGFLVAMAREGGAVSIMPSVEGGSLRIVFRAAPTDVSEQMLPKLFTPFGGASPGDVTSECETGLNLPLAKRIVDLLDGKFSAEVGDGGTLAFDLSLPVDWTPFARGGEQTS